MAWDSPDAINFSFAKRMTETTFYEKVNVEVFLLYRVYQKIKRRGGGGEHATIKFMQDTSNVLFCFLFNFAELIPSKNILASRIPFPKSTSC